MSIYTIVVPKKFLEITLADLHDDKQLARLLEEAYRKGYDDGWDQGWQDERADPGALGIPIAITPEEEKG